MICQYQQCFLGREATKRTRQKVSTGWVETTPQQRSCFALQCGRMERSEWDQRQSENSRPLRGFRPQLAGPCALGMSTQPPSHVMTQSVWTASFSMKPSPPRLSTIPLAPILLFPDYINSVSFVGTCFPLTCGTTPMWKALP